MEKLERGASDVITDKNSNLSLVWWKDSKAVTVASTFVGKMPPRKAHGYVKAQTCRAEIDQAQSIFLCNKGMGGVDRLNQNISSYMISHRSKKWWWPVFRFCLDLSVNNAYQLYRQQKRSEGERKLDLLGFRRSIVDAYYRCLRKSTTTNISPSCKKVVESQWWSSIWCNQSLDRQGKATEMASCQKSTLYFCEKCNVGIHPDCHKQFHIEK